MPLEVGLSREDSRVVGPEDSAQRVSTLAPDVYASARMIGFAETVCAELMAEHLPAGLGSCGIGFNSGKHVRAIIRTEKFLAKIAEKANRYMTR